MKYIIVVYTKIHSDNYKKIIELLAIQKNIEYIAKNKLIIDIIDDFNGIDKIILKGDNKEIMSYDKFNQDTFDSIYKAIH